MAKKPEEDPCFWGHAKECRHQGSDPSGDAWRLRYGRKGDARISLTDISKEVLGVRHGQVGGDHYRIHKIQPWDIWEEYNLDPWRANTLKYLLRAGDKGPAVQDLKKALHYLQKCIENEEGKEG